MQWLGARSGLAIGARGCGDAMRALDRVEFMIIAVGFVRAAMAETRRR